MSDSVNLERIDSILAPWAATIGPDFAGYRNHVVRMATFCVMLGECSPEGRQKVEIAACLHDSGVWIEDTLDYLGPSVPPAMRYLEEHGRSAWSADIRRMIVDHHKLTRVDDDAPPLVELFRQGDLVDFSLGWFRCGLSREQVGAVRDRFPNAGFHRCLVRRATQWVRKHPFDPAPMMKW